MGIRAKFRVEKVTQHAWNTAARTITLSPQYDQTIAEDRRFCDATPSGTFEMLVNNPAAIAQLQLGQQFYIDLTPVE